MLPPVGPLYCLPHPSRLRQPGLTLSKKVVADLLLSSPAPPALVVHRLVDLVLQIGAYRRMACQELVISARD